MREMLGPSEGLGKGRSESPAAPVRQAETKEFRSSLFLVRTKGVMADLCGP